MGTTQRRRWSVSPVSGSVLIYDVTLEVTTSFVTMRTWDSVITLGSSSWCDEGVRGNVRRFLAVFTVMTRNEKWDYRNDSRLSSWLLPTCRS